MTPRQGLLCLGVGQDMPVVRAGKKAHAKDVCHMLGLEHHGPTVSLWEAPQAHLGTPGAPLLLCITVHVGDMLLRWALQVIFPKL